MLNPPVSPQTWLYLLHSFTQFSQYFNIIVVTDSLALGTHCVIITLDIEEKSQHGLEIRGAHGKIYALGEFDDFECVDCRFVSRSYVSLISSTQVITDFNKFGSLLARC
jgi:hypothetical protein